MRVLVAGSRTFKDYRLMQVKLNEYTGGLSSFTGITGDIGLFRYYHGRPIISGAELLAKKWFFENGKGYEVYHPGADGIASRNREMVDVAKAVIVFWDGVSKNTNHLIWYAKKLKRQLRVVRFENET